MAPAITREHFRKAALEIGQSGENDTLPYDIDAQFVKDRSDELSEICFRFFGLVNAKQRKQAAAFMNELPVVSERLLSPTGSHGFRITTKIHPFWNLYLNGLALGIAEANENRRSPRVHSYRLGGEAPSFFDRSSSWRTYKEATLADPALMHEGAVVVQTDISRRR
jgi:hypothetical protein